MITFEVTEVEVFNEGEEPNERLPTVQAQNVPAVGTRGGKRKRDSVVKEGHPAK